MAIDKNADFTPSIPDSGVVPTKLPYNPTGGFKFWAQKVIPLVYDDSLSYYEVLCKVVNYLNNVIQNVDNLNESVNSTNQSFETLKGYVNTTKDTLINTYNELQDYVNTYFDNLDVQEEINEKLDAMADSGELTNLLAPFIPDLVTQWLNNHVTPTSPIIDNTLTISGAGADAKVTGDKITELKEDFISNVSIVSTSDFDTITGTDITYTRDDTKGEITITNSGTGNYSGLQTKELLQDRIVPGKTYTVHAKAETLTGSPNIHVAIRGTSTNVNGIARTFNFVNGEVNNNFIADQYMKRVVLFVSNDSSTPSSSAKFSSLWVREYNDVAVDGKARKDTEKNYDRISVVNKNTESILFGEGGYSTIDFPFAIDGNNKYSASNNRHLMIPVNSGDIIDIKGNGTYTGYVAFLQKFDVPSNTDNPSFSEAEGFTTRIKVSVNTDYSYTVPNDANYLYVSKTMSSNNTMPKIIKINGIDMLSSVYRKISNVESVANTIQKQKNLLKINGLISGEKWEKSDTFFCVLYPVNPGDSIEGLVKGGNTAYIAGLKNNTITWGATPSYSDVSGWTSLITIDTANGPVIATIPTDVHYLYMYYGTDANIRLPKNVFVNGYDIVDSIEGNITSYEFKPVPLSVMQYNAGEFTFGSKNSYLYEDATGNQEYSFDQIVANYRAMLCKYHPDIACMEEYKDVINVVPSGESPGTYEEKNMGNLIVKYPYPSKYLYAYYRLCSLSKIGKPIYSYRTSFTYTYDGESYEKNYAVYYYLYHGRKLCFINTALYHYSDNVGVARRSIELETLLDAFSGEEYPFIVLDMNNGGNRLGNPETLITSVDEGEQLLTLANGKGWTFAMGSYLPFIKTWLPPHGSGYPDNNACIDNIVFKNNGKIILKNFTRITESEFYGLSSDHCPVVADFMLL